MKTVKMWNGMRKTSAPILVFTSFMLFVVVLSSPSPKPLPASSTSSFYSRRLSLRSKSPANLHLQTLRSSRQIPSPPALYSAPKEQKEAQVQPPPPVYGPPSADDESSATTEAVTEESFEGASTSTPESDGEVIVADNEVSPGTERTEYLPPTTNPSKRKRVKDNQMVENNPFHQIQIHVVPPHLSQNDHNNDILGTSYGVPEMMIGSHAEFHPNVDGGSGQYLPPQGREEVSPQHHVQQGASYGEQEHEHDEEQIIEVDHHQQPSKEYETPRRDESEREQGQQKSTQIYQVPTYSSSSQPGYSSPSQSQSHSAPTVRNQYRGQEQHEPQSGYPIATQYNNPVPSSGQGYRTAPQQEQRPRQTFEESQATPNSLHGYNSNSKSQPQSQQNEGYRSQQQQGNQISRQQSSNFGYSHTPLDYQSPSADHGYQSQQPQQQQGYSQNQINHEDNAVVIHDFSTSPQTQQTQQPAGYPSPPQSYAQQPQPQSHTPPQQSQPQSYAPPQQSQPQSYAPPQQSQPQSYAPPQQSYPAQEAYSPNQFPAQLQYSTPSQAPFESQRVSSPIQSSTSEGYSIPQNQFQHQTYDQQPALTSTSKLQQPQPLQQSAYQANQYDVQGYPASRPQPQRNPSNPTNSVPAQQPQSAPSPQSQYFQGNFFSQQPQPQIRSNSLDSESQTLEEELEGLNGRIVDSALLQRVQQIIEEHERQQKALLANFNNNSPDKSTSSNAEYGVPLFSSQQNYQSAQGQAAFNQRIGQSQPQPQQGFGRHSNSGGGYTESNNGIQYQKAILSQQFTETSPINSPKTNQQPFTQKSSPPTDAQGVGSSKPEGLKVIPSPQLGQEPQPQARDNIETPKPVYGVPLAPVIGLDSNENFKVVDESEGHNGRSQLVNNFLQQTPHQLYGRNRRRVVAKVMKLNNSSPRISIPHIY